MRSPSLKKPSERKSSDSERESELVKQVRLAQRGNNQAVEKLIELTHDRLYRFCLVLTHDRNEAEDLAHDSYVRVLERIKKLRDQKSFVHWLFRIAKNLFLDSVRGQKNKPHEEISQVLTRKLPSESGERAPALVALKELLSPLKPEDQIILIIVELEGLSYSEAAEIIGISEQALRSRLHRIRERLELQGLEKILKP